MPITFFKGDRFVDITNTGDTENFSVMRHQIKNTEDNEEKIAIELVTDLRGGKSIGQEHCPLFILSKQNKTKDLQTANDTMLAIS